ncbi:MAG: helix-turn-helix domain-containing protein [Firmicutes bacterium]|nr:helix-turn-helix domain-containing protein [Bacillota bacterium]
MHEIIRKLRKERGLTQQQVADYLQIDRSTYAYYESGRTLTNIDVVVKLAHFYQVRYAVLLGPEPVPAGN